MIPGEETVSVAEAKRRLSDLLGRVAYGHVRITIARRGKPMAVLSPVDESSQGLGGVKGWLSAKDPFLRHVRKAIKGRKRLSPRSIRL